MTNIRFSLFLESLFPFCMRIMNEINEMFTFRRIGIHRVKASQNCRVEEKNFYANCGHLQPTILTIDWSLVDYACCYGRTAGYIPSILQQGRFTTSWLLPRLIPESTSVVYVTTTLVIGTEIVQPRSNVKVSRRIQNWTFFKLLNKEFCI